MILIFMSAYLCCDLLNADARSDTDTKRLVLHSELDIAHEFATLRQELKQYKDEIQKLTSRLNEQDEQMAKILAVSGSVYTRWGRTTCPTNGTSLVYSGYMAGTYSDHGSGSGANYLCLAGQPTWDYFSETINNDIRVTGVEYEFRATHDHDIQAIFGANILDSEAPCSVCRSKRSTSVMIPGRKDCYPGWAKEYSGYLVGSHPTYDDSTEYVCLDRRPETVVHSGNSDNDNMIYFVESFCGKSLECPPYVHNRELACVVCSM